MGKAAAELLQICFPWPAEITFRESNCFNKWKISYLQTWNLGKKASWISRRIQPNTEQPMMVHVFNRTALLPYKLSQISLLSNKGQQWRPLLQQQHHHCRIPRCHCPIEEGTSTAVSCCSVDWSGPNETTVEMSTWSSMSPCCNLLPPSISPNGIFPEDSASS